MIKAFVLLRKNPSVSEAFFHEHWRTVHAGHALRIGSLRRYTQSHRLSSSVAGLPSASFDGVAEIWVDDTAALLAQREDPNYTEYAMKDEPTFIDLGAMATLCTPGERELAPSSTQAPSSAKVMIFTMGGTKPADSEMSQAVLRLGYRLVRATASTVVQEMSGPAATTGYTGVIELSWPTLRDYESSWNGQGQRFIAELRSVADVRAGAGLLVEELRFIWPDAADKRGRRLHVGSGN